MKQLKRILWIILILLFGFFLGIETVSYLYKKHFASRTLNYSSTGSGKINALINAIDRKYVDVVDMDSIIDCALPVILEELDPHSAYYPAEETQVSNDELHGSFSGIGIQFSMQDDTVRVNSVIHGGPSEKVGVLAGDRIILINDSVFAGRKISSNEIVKNLKGPKGTTVKISVLRNGEPNLMDFTIERGDIPVKSVDAAYMISQNDGIGYIMINKFGETTFTEMMTSLAELSSKGMKKLIIDLRSNSGGYLGAAIQMANEFLPKNDLIVYTQGAHYPISRQYANGHGHYTSTPLVVMIDESSASAAEIFTGAIQDNDRGTIVGRRSFGKGLVQEPIEFNDGSSIRITIARYYTPSGRCIQKPYGESDEDYAMDIVKRYEHGEFFSADSIKQNEDEVYTTKGGRTVYGGGGIMPDIFVAQDTTGYSDYYSSVVRKSLVNKYSFRYVDENRKTFSSLKTYSDIEKFLDSNNVLGKFYDYAAKNGVKKDNSLSAPALRQMRTALYGNIIYDALDMEDYISFINLTDPTVLKAIETLK